MIIADSADLTCFYFLLACSGHTSDEDIDKDMALAYMGLRPRGSGLAVADSADPTWLDRDSPPVVPVLSSDEEAPAQARVRVCLFWLWL
jgi:hypothetical protein